MIQDYGNSIYAIDAHFERDGLVSIYLIRDSGRAAFVDTANSRALPYVLDAMKELDIPRENIDAVFLTHVHLDHAGGAGLFMREFPNAKLIVHPRGARHMIDPSKLLAGVREVYGAEEAERMYGGLIPVKGSRVLTPADGDEITIGGRTIVCLDTPGHARHHMVYFDKEANAVFTGDAFGVTHSEFYADGRRSLLPTTSPVQFDPEAMRRSIDRIAGLEPTAVYLTHFGELRDVRRLAAELHRLLDEYLKVVTDAKGDPEKTRAALGELFEAERVRKGWTISAAELREAFRIEIKLSSQGLCLWYANRETKKRREEERRIHQNMTGA